MIALHENIGLKWQKKQCEIIGDKIVEVLSVFGEDYTKNVYRPFETSDIHLKFASINENDNKDIINFINNYGFLHEKLDQSYKKITPEWEYLNTFQKEVRDFKSIVKIYELLKNVSFSQLHNLVWKNPNFQSLKEEVDDFISRSYIDPTYMDKHKEEIIRIAIMSIISHKIDCAISNSKPSLYPIDLKECTFALVWDTKDLLDTIYIMFMNDLTNSKKIRQCRNDTCSNFFQIYGNDERKEYCSTSCAKAQAQREYRKRIKKANKESESNGR